MRELFSANYCLFRVCMIVLFGKYQGILPVGLYLILILICFYRPDFISNQVSLFKSISSGNNEMYLNYNDKHVKVKYSPNQNNGANSDAFSTFGLVRFCSGNRTLIDLFCSVWAEQ